MADSLWLPVLLSSVALWIVLHVVLGVALECGSSQLLVDHCSQGQSVAVDVCVFVGTSITITCNLQDTTAAWLSPYFDNPASVSSSITMSTQLFKSNLPNQPTITFGEVDLKFINQTSTCIRSSATIHAFKATMNGALDLFCWSNEQEGSGANISIVIVDGTIASVKQIGIDLTTDDKHVDLEFSDNQQCQFDKYLISEGSCSQQDDQATIQMFELPSPQGTINVNSFSSLCVSACTEEDACTCQKIVLDNFTVTYSHESTGETSYSVLLLFSHDVLIEGVEVSPQGNGANCSANNQTSRRVMLLCSNLSNSTTYSIAVRGNASLNNSGSGYQSSAFDVSLDFLTTAHTDNVTADGKGWSGGAIAGIVLGIVIPVIIVAVAGIIATVWVVFRFDLIAKCRRKATDVDVEELDTTVPAEQNLELNMKIDELNKVEENEKRLQKELSETNVEKVKLKKDIENLRRTS